MGLPFNYDMGQGLLFIILDLVVGNQNKRSARRKIFEIKYVKTDRKLRTIYKYTPVTDGNMVKLWCSDSGNYR